MTAMSVRKIALSVVAAATLVAGIAWFAPLYRDMARRSQVSNVILAASPAREEITARAARTKSLAGAGRGLAIVAAGSVTGGSVSDDGVIVVHGTVDGHPIELALKPRLSGDRVEWRCGALKVVEGWFVPTDGYFPRACPRVASLSML